jgi:hypothetical protein
VTLLIGRSGTVPVTWGVVYPVVLLPADAAGWTAERRRLVLLHELAHVERFDALTHAVSQLALALFWFNPLVLAAVRRLRTERERACDDLVLASGARPSAYADNLLDIVRSLQAPAPAAAALAMARKSEFEGRLLAILDPAVRRARTSRARTAAAVALVLAAAVPLAGARPTVAAARASASPAPELAAGRTWAGGRDAAGGAAVGIPAATGNPTRAVSESPHAGVVPPSAAGAPPQQQDEPERVEVRDRASSERTGSPPPRMSAPAPLATVAAAPATAAALGAARGARECTPRTGRHVSIHDDGDRVTTVIADRTHCLFVESAGRVEFTDDDTDVQRLAPRGHLTIEETRGVVTRRAELRERGGRIEREYSENDRELPAALGAARRRAELPAVIRESAIGAEARVTRIRRQRGVQGVLDEVGLTASDNAKRAYLERLVAGGSLTRDELSRTADVARRTLASDGDKAAVLRLVAEAGGRDPQVAAAVIDGASSIASDGDRRRVLQLASADPATSIEVLTLVASSAAGIASDGDKAAVLLGVAPRAGASQALRSAFFRAAR